MKIVVIFHMGIGWIYPAPRMPVKNEGLAPDSQS